MSWRDELVDRNNLHAAYRRARHFVEYGESLGNQRELALWEDDLEGKLDRVQYLLEHPPAAVPCHLVVVPRPEQGFRAYYSLDLEYQVAWTAIIQTLGPALDRRMPSWSFGYRLHRPRVHTAAGWQWEDHNTLSRDLYLGFERGWKPFRRYANLSIANMLGAGLSDDEVEQSLWHTESTFVPSEPVPLPGESLHLDLRHRRFPFLEATWGNRSKRLWYARLDVKTFFPSVRAADAVKTAVAELAGLYDEQSRKAIAGLLGAWSRFKQLRTGIPEKERRHLTPELVIGGGLPVGAIASGFLANVRLLPIDRVVDRAVREQFDHRVAVLRYVDDWVIVGADRESLCRCLGLVWRQLADAGLRVNLKKLYPRLLDESAPKRSQRAFVAALERGGDPLRLKAFAPSSFVKVKGSVDSFLEIWRRAGTITEHRRSEFMSTTLQRMSFRGLEEVAILDDEEIDARVLDLEDLSANVRDTSDVRIDTVHAFTAGQLRRTPLVSPATLAQLSKRRQQSSDDNESDSDVLWVEGTIARIGWRARRIVAHLTDSLFAAPHKRHLLQRWVETCANASEWEASTAGLDSHVKRIAEFLATGAVDDQQIVGEGTNADRDRVRDAVLFLRAIFWRSLSEMAGRCTEQLASRSAMLEPSWAGWPTPAARSARTANWLSHCGSAVSLRLARVSRRNQSRSHAALLERNARDEWLRWQAWLRGKPLPIDTVVDVLDLRFARAAWIPWAIHAPDTETGRRASELIKRLGKGNRQRSGLRAEILLAWVSDAPIQRLSADVLEGLLRSRGPSASIGWMVEMIWRVLSSSSNESALLILGQSRNARLRAYVAEAIQQRAAIDNRSQGRSVSLRALLESTVRPGDGMAAGARPPEAVSVAVVRAILAWARNAPRPAFLSLDNLFVKVEAWASLLRRVENGKPPRDLVLRYERVDPDGFFVARRSKIGHDSRPVAAGLCSMAFCTDIETLRRMAPAGTRARYTPLHIEIALDHGTVLSGALTSAMVTLIEEGGKSRGHTTADKLLDSCRYRLEKHARRLAHRSTRRAKKSVYSIAFGDGAIRSASKAWYDFFRPRKGLIERLEVLVAQVDLNIDVPGNWHFSSSRVRMTPSFAEGEAWPRVWAALRASRSGNARSFARVGEPRLLVLPELVVPRSRVPVLQRFSQRENTIVVAGVEYRSRDGWVRNEVVVAVPNEHRHPRANSRLHWVGKRHPMSREWAALDAHHLRFIGASDVAVLAHPELGRMGVSVCYDLYSVEVLAALQRRVLHYVVAAHNQDLNTFNSLAETAMRLFVANVVLANSGKFGGSLVVSPYYDSKEREVLRVQGAHVETVERVHVPVRALQEEQSKDKLAQWKADAKAARAKAAAGIAKDKPVRRFKEKPADWY